MSNRKEDSRNKTCGKLSAAVVLAAVFAAGWLARDLVGFRPGSVAPRAATTPSVTAIVVTNAVFNPVREFVGRVEPVQEVDVLPQIDGYLTSAKFSEGATVRRGDVLYEIDVERYEAAHRLRLAELEQAKSQSAEAVAAKEKADRYLARLKAADGRGVPQTDLDSAEAEANAAKAACESARAKIAQAEANLMLAAVDVKHTKIHAPMSGRIGKSLMHVGDYVTPSKGRLARIVQSDPIRVSFPLSDREYMTWLEEAAKRGTDARASRRLRLRLPNDSVYGVEGAWEFDDNEIDPSTATIQLRLSFENPKGLLVPNSFVRVLSDERNPQKVLVVPDAAIVAGEDGCSVWVVADDCTVARRRIAKGPSAEGLTVVAKGLAEGERIVHRGVHKLNEGMKVNLAEAE